MKLTGDKELLRMLNNLNVDLNKATNDGLNATATIIKGRAVRSIQEQSSGDAVKRPRQGGGTYTHIASKPGDAPNTDTGRLVQSIAIEPAKTKPVAYVGTSVKYGKWLEFGTSDMAARPWLTPASEDSRNEFMRQLKNAVVRQLKKAGK